MSAQSDDRLHAVMLIWHGVAGGTEADYLNWHTSEHMTERLDLPGFIRGRRAHSPECVEQPYISIYEADEADTFGSQTYRDRVNSPTPWSRRLHPKIINVIRGVFDMLAVRGAGVARSTLTIRMGASSVSPAQLAATAAELCESVSKLSGVTSVRFGLAHRDATTSTTATDRGPDAADRVNAVLLVDSYDSALLRAQCSHIVGLAQASGLTIQPESYAVYDVAYVLNSREPRGVSMISREPAPDDTI